ncbi:acetylornithine aminotransferase [Janibacter hoylei PVAS-1]|uniref:Acetylornithine aminotransferase n=1 Tax=Janibacter hoylei PVAS-1 TaxID=1210046 RepID=K1DZP5_9MICO|nr:acetylornithine transaminase [Janibacter hoylei]EKA61839.1 acetylornithine aminotransferase [Janibacter hoylei PVAS-1]RWU85429.1 acetylornithine transaminase [Janibacter hoylei PVAS-1]
MTDVSAAHQALLERYRASHIGVFGLPGLVLTRGEGAYVWDVDGTRYLDLLGGIAVNALGHGHPELVAAISKQAGELVHVSNFFTTPAQIEAAEALLRVARAPHGSGVFFCNSGSEAVETAIKLSRRTGRTGIVAVGGAFHGRTTGAVSLTHKEAYRAPFEPLLPGVTHVAPGDVDALRAAVGPDTAMVLLEPIQGEAGVVTPPAGYLAAAREITREAGALLVLDEIQTGIGRTGAWFAHQLEGVVPDAITVAKGLGGGVPIGGLVTFGAEVTGLLTAGQHGSTFGGNPLACSAALAVIATIEEEGLIEHAVAAGEHLVAAVEALQHPLVTQVRGAGLLRAIGLARPIAPAAALVARRHGVIVNPVAPDALRLAPPLTITTDQLSSFVDALLAILDEAAKESA